MKSHFPPQNHGFSSIPELTVKGSPYEIGLQHGEAFSQQIRGFVDDHLARVNLLRNRPLERDEAMRIAGRYALWIERDLPAIAEEIAGVAHGAGIKYEEAVLLQIRRELIHTGSKCGDCTSIVSRNEEGDVVVAQTIDLAGRMGDLALILRIIPEDPVNPSLCMFTFMGLCGYAGFNSVGLAAGLNMVFSSSWREGVPVYLLLRSLLGKRSIAEAHQDICRIHRASSRYLALADSQSVTGFELTVDDIRTFTVLPLVHTNHYLHPDFQRIDTLDGAVLECSKKRADRAHRLLEQEVPLELILQDHDNYPRSICAHNLGNSAVTDTVAAIVMNPAKVEMKALVGHPCERSFQRHRLL